MQTLYRADDERAATLIPMRDFNSKTKVACMVFILRW